MKNLQSQFCPLLSLLLSRGENPKRERKPREPVSKNSSLVSLPPKVDFPPSILCCVLGSGGGVDSGILYNNSFLAVCTMSQMIA